MWLWGLLNASAVHGALYAPGVAVEPSRLASASVLAGRLEALRGRSVLLAANDQLTTALALIELDGVARRMVLCPPDLVSEHLPAVIELAAVDACVTDSSRSGQVMLDTVIEASGQLTPGHIMRQQTEATEWVLLTSGTSGVPKLVAHSCAGLTNAFAGKPCTDAAVWSTFYDIRRYGGLQILLRALAGGSMVLSAAGEPVTQYLSRVGAAGVTHISGTPSHWRRALMSGATGAMAPRYIRLSGEIADQAILDALRDAYPKASIEHAFASTEAGVVCAVADGLAGLPREMLEAGGMAEIRLVNGSLQVRGPGTATRYLGIDAPALRDREGFVDTGDRLELRAGRFYFMGRAGGIINVGGLKVHPEEVETVINTHPRVRMSLVSARRSPITGAVVIAEVVLSQNGANDEDMVRAEILACCRQSLPAHKVPVAIRLVPALEVSASGKLVRRDA
jgi:acyl-coenzyme A synthetase/AMP-(fatty) acid ligase